MLNFVYKEFIRDKEICELQISEFKKIFTANNINIREFFSNLKDVLMKKHMKKNSIRLVGVPNSCKTLIANCIVKPFICCYNNNHGSENEFYLSNMLNKAIVLCEELYITIATCEDFKSILSGQAIDISKKYNEKQLLCRTPIIITTNFDKFGRGHLSETDESALRIRCFNYRFTTPYEPIVRLDAINFYHLFFREVY